jgi:anion-transporting  ArsA/GET3 family ATPase
MTEMSGFYAQSSVVIVVGKGGVGKSTVSATVASVAARHGLSVLLVELDDRSGPSRIFGHQTLTSGGVDVSTGTPDDRDSRPPQIRVRKIAPDDALVEHLVDHGFGRAANRLARSGMLDLAATAIPGIRDILLLGKIVQLERAHTADLIVVDGPAAGHATTFLTSAQGLLESSRAGPIHAKAADVVGFLSDPTRCQAVLVTLAEETPVNESVETALTLRDRVGMHFGPVMVNCIYQMLDHLDAEPETAAAAAGLTLQPGEANAMRAAAAFRRRRHEMQAEQTTRLTEALSLPQLWLPLLFTAEMGLPEIDLLSDAVETGLAHLREPAGRAAWTGPTNVAPRVHAPEHAVASMGSSW